MNFSSNFFFLIIISLSHILSALPLQTPGAFYVPRKPFVLNHKVMQPAKEGRSVAAAASAVNSAHKEGDNHGSLAPPSFVNLSFFIAHAAMQQRQTQTHTCGTRTFQQARKRSDRAQFIKEFERGINLLVHA